MQYVIQSGNTLTEHKVSELGGVDAKRVGVGVELPEHLGHCSGGDGSGESARGLYFPTLEDNALTLLLSDPALEQLLHEMPELCHVQRPVSRDVVFFE